MCVIKEGLRALECQKACGSVPYNFTDLSSYVPSIHGMPNKPLKQDLEKLKVIPDNRFWSKLEYSELMRSTVHPGLEI